jgi:hypothetical protein
MPSWMRKGMMRSKIYRIFFYLNPRFVIKSLDMLIVMMDKDARGYFQIYLWWLKKRLSPSHPTYLFRRTKIKELKDVNFLYGSGMPPSLQKQKCRVPLKTTLPEDDHSIDQPHLDNA